MTSPKAALLAAARAGGLPVPAAALLPDELVRAPAGAVPPLPPALRSARVAVRSAFSGEDGATESMAGRFLSVLDVPASDDAALAEAVARVVASGDRAPEAARRRDVLVMRMVPARTAGVAFTQRDFEDDIVEWVPGLADALVSGRAPGRRTELPRLRGRERGRRGAPGRLARLLRGVRRVLGDADWDVEWADDGRRCWLVQVRPVTRPPRRDEVFTLANHKEILPPLPSRLMTGLIAANGPRLFDWFRAFDDRLPASRPMVEDLHGRPMINLSLLADMMRLWGLPPRLVTDSLGGPPDVAGSGRVRPGRILRSSPALARIARAQARDARASAAAGRDMVERVRSAPPGAGPALDALSEVHVRLVAQMSALTSAAGLPVALLRATGTLAEHAARERSAATRMIDDLAPLRELARRDPGLTEALARGETPPAAAPALAAWLARHGDRGPYESDVASPRYGEGPGPAVAALLAAPERRAPLPPRTFRGRLTLPLWHRARGPLQAREELRRTAMTAFGEARRRLLAAARTAVAEGRLAVVEDLWLLDPSEARRLDEGWTVPAELTSARRAERARLAALHPPDIVRRLDDPAAFSAGGVSAPRLRGVSLTAGEVRGRAWVLREPDPGPPPWPGPVVLVAPAVDPGWIPVFARVDGVAVETGGDLSHGSIVLREIGLPAVTNLTGLTTAVRSGDPVLLRASAGVLERV